MDITDLTATQLANALQIYRAAMPFGEPAAMAALMCAGAESSYLRYANDGSTTRDDVPARWRAIAAMSLRFPHDAVAGGAWTTADSVGLFQQRPMFGYCTPDLAGIGTLMDPAESTRVFLRGSHGGAGATRHFLQSPKEMTLAQRVQWVQGSEFPTGENYVGLTRVATTLMARFRVVEGQAVSTTADITDWITMADQGILDEQWDRIADKVAAKVWDIQTNADIMALHNKALFAQDTGVGMSLAAQLAQLLARLDHIEQALRQRVG
jgi:hypothetical protein